MEQERSEEEDFEEIPMNLIEEGRAERPMRLMQMAAAGRPLRIDDSNNNPVDGYQVGDVETPSTDACSDECFIKFCIFLIVVVTSVIGAAIIFGLLMSSGENTRRR